MKAENVKNALGLVLFPVFLPMKVSLMDLDEQTQRRE